MACQASSHPLLDLGRQLPAGLSRRAALAAVGATLAAPWVHTRAAGVGGGRTVTLVVSYPAGGGADLMARIIAPRMAEALGQGVVVDNKPGASGQLAASAVARATPDGTTPAPRPCGAR